MINKIIFSIIITLVTNCGTGSTYTPCDPDNDECRRPIPSIEDETPKSTDERIEIDLIEDMTDDELQNLLLVNIDHIDVLLWNIRDKRFVADSIQRMEDRHHNLKIIQQVIDTRAKKNSEGQD